MGHRLRRRARQWIFASSSVAHLKERSDDMAGWYLISGIVMAVGAYFTIRYHPYCTLKMPERLHKVFLHWKEVNNETLTRNEKKIYDEFMGHTFRHAFGDFLLIVGSLFHLAAFFTLFRSDIAPLYYVSIACIAPLFVTRTYMLPYCFQRFPAIMLWDMKNEYQDALNAYKKKLYNDSLKPDEQKVYSFETSNRLKIYFLYRYITLFGVVMHLTIDLWIGFLL
jgi:hypothetical protein